jgi:hypothetical protein
MANESLFEIKDIRSTESLQSIESIDLGKRLRRLRKMRKPSLSLRSLSFLKKLSWRLTATWAWIHLITDLLRLPRWIFYPERLIYALIERICAATGFSPSNAALFPTILKLGWLALILNSEVIPCVFFFLFYIPTFPLTMLFLAARGKTYREEVRKNTQKSGLFQPRPKRNLTVPIFGLLLAWLLLYGGSQAKYPQIAGIIISGALLLRRSYSAFLFAGPIEQVRIQLAQIVENFSVNYEAATSKNSKALDGSIGLIRIGLFFVNVIYYLLLKAALFTRGSRGRSRAAIFVLLQYVINLFILGAATVVFWAITIRCYAQSAKLDLAQAILASAARVLPGLEVPSGLHLPLWVQVGSSISAWLFFVVYAGPAASIFPMVQQSYVTAISDAYKSFRKAAVSMMHYMRKLEARIAVQATLGRASGPAEATDVDQPRNLAKSVTVE